MDQFPPSDKRNAITDQTESTPRFPFKIVNKHDILPTM